MASLSPSTFNKAVSSTPFSVKPAFINFFGGFHGGAIASIAEAVLVATARTVVVEDKELFLGELSISYLSSAPKNVV
ncbi:putative HotDog domain-containing protein [Rosa chinensis]|uniref:Putative HotDog domain-containing protein n=1 Tax=Rosa chinensis TaxID=74649 RepID=A0A2P6QAE8_ROSCH|nr:putative HotDog domain-containing protein [Rosa chinensis]